MIGSCEEVHLIDLLADQLNVRHRMWPAMLYRLRNGLINS
jgi:hypothetical protein